MFLNETKRDLEVELEHHGVKGMKWGRRLNPHPGVRKEAKSDLKKVTSSPTLKGAKEAKRTIKEKSAARPNYAKEAQRAQKIHKNQEAGKKFVKSAARAYILHTIVKTAVQGSSSGTRRTSAGQNYVRSNPQMMNAKVGRDGTFKVTNL